MAAVNTQRALDLEEVAAWKVNCPDAGEQKIALKADSAGFNWSAQDVENFWEAVVSGRPLGSFTLRRGDGLPVLEDGEQRATAVALGFYDPWEKNADAWEGLQKEGMRRFSPQPEGPRGILWIDLAKPAQEGVSYVFRLVTHDEPWGFLRNRKGHLPAHGARLAWENFIRVVRCQKEIPANESLPGWASGDTLPLAWAWPWDAKTPMPFSLLCELAGIATPEWEEFLLFSIENNPMWQLDCPMPTAATHCWKEKICQILKHREGEDYQRLSALVKLLPGALKGRIPVVEAE
ncbi:MAG: hypothetical protein HDR50_00655 [Desulfovibrio sp.]|uniref:hypothetical protein n=1 Tax=Desulfovibrio sp. TaxID=885 RepID=UPI001A6EB57B|nr:hypothetical protein [Desulfovibrio sp.]MBD5416202.1 hypothetical protein [Desulfovibrio sp.]